MLKRKKTESDFYSNFNRFMTKIIAAGDHFYQLVDHYDNVEENVATMKVLETECDLEVHRIIKEFHQWPNPPFDRQEAYAIAKELDDIVDSMEEVANHFIVFDIQEMKPEAKEMAGILIQAIGELDTLFKNLHEMKKTDVVKEQIIEVNRVENEGDAAFRKALKRLFKEEKDPLEVIKWQHILEDLEDSIDACEKVANIIEGISMKYV